MTTKSESKKPVARIRVGSVHASIWRNAKDKGTFYNVTFERRYKDRDDQWQGTQNYGAGDLLELAKAADLAHTRILELASEAAEEAAA
jgi:hypothetical protein